MVRQEQKYRQFLAPNWEALSFLLFSSSGPSASLTEATLIDSDESSYGRSLYGELMTLGAVLTWIANHIGLGSVKNAIRLSPLRFYS